MSTRSEIGIQNKNGVIESIYCHWDGYLAHNGLILYLYYNTEEKVRELIKNGDLSSLSENIEPDKNREHSFNNPKEDVCVYYHRDREECWEQVKPSRTDNIKSWKKNLEKNCQDYGYLFKNGKWYFLDLDYAEVPLKELTYEILKAKLKTLNRTKELKLLEEFENKKAINVEHTR